ncbi:MAG: MOSC domain-containing protein [Gemmatimonadaceae bacterium]
MRTPTGQELELRSEALRRDVAARFGSDVELMSLKNGIFDDAFVSVISLVTVAAVGREAGVGLDVRRFRPNVVLDTDDAEPFREVGWVGGRLVFGGAEPRVMVNITADDVRCMMINLDPDSARQDARVMRAVVRRHGNVAGVYGAAGRTGTVHVGQEVWLEPDDVLAGRELRSSEPKRASSGGGPAA